LIGIVDYGLGNLGSVSKAFRHVGAEAVLTGDAERLLACRALVLPGDGAFGATMDEVRRRGLVPVLLEAARRGTPLLGICIGMQVLFEESEEHGRNAGLGLLPGRVRRFETELPVPHMGWNALRRVRDHPLLEGMADGSHVYFVHSYYCDAGPETVLATSDYGIEFAAVVGRGSIVGVQFHPEKSQAVGLRMIEQWVRRCVAPAVRLGEAALERRP
jgi:glutamine amidotransferase